MTLCVQRCSTAAEFWERAAVFLLRAEPQNNLPIGLALNVIGGDAESPDNYWAVVEDDGAVVGAVFRTQPWPLGVTAMPDAATALVARDAHRIWDELPGINGPKPVATRVAQHWQSLTGAAWRIRMTQRIHVLERVNAPQRAVGGRLREMTADDTALVHNWFEGFARDADLAFLPAGQAQRVLQSGYGRIWDDAGPKCMVTATRETPTGRTVNAVYTPPEFRGRGYASAAVSEFSQAILAEGKRFCCLYTDTGNPTSNHIYQSIGYRPLREDVEIVFDH